MQHSRGEVLSSFFYLPEQTYATEQYPPNVEIARNRLAKQNVEVIQIFEDKYPNNKKLPFADNQFDLIINRHDDFDVNELKRILKKTGFSLLSR